VPTAQDQAKGNTVMDVSKKFSSAPTLPVQRTAWGLLLIPAVAQFVLHVATNGRFGLFRDEYYYLACAARPAFGYVDQPPFSIWLLSAWKGLFGDSLQSIRILPALCGSALIVMTGAAAAQLGGGRWAQLLAGVAAAVGAAGLVICGSYSMNSFDLLFWLGAYYLLIRIARTGDGRLWLWMGLVLGLGLFNKIGLFVFGLAMLIGLLLTRHRRHFADKRLYIAGLIAAVFIAPYIVWNITHDWATLEFIKNATSGKITHFSPVDYLQENILEANPFTLPVWVGGFLWLLLARRARCFQIVAWVFAATFVILIVQNSKPYYFASSFPVLMAAGGVAWELWTNRRWLKWIRWALLASSIAGGVVLAPIAVPLLSPEDTVAYARRLGINPAPQEVGFTSALPQHFSDRLGWENLARVVSSVYMELPPDERDHCVVIGQNYGEAGALEYWSRRYELPPAYTTHNNYWFWGPPDDSCNVAIVVGGSRERLQELFAEVKEAGIAESPYAMESHLTIRVCRGLRRPMKEIWREYKSFG